MRIRVLTGAGISAESGIPTFRGKDGLWKGFRAEDLATPQAFSKNPIKVWEWYCWRRQIIGQAEPNEAHKLLADWERSHDLWIITQNVDGLHQRAGSKNVVELHGNIWRLRCTACGKVWEDEKACSKIPPRCECGAIARPDVVWFGEALPSEAIRKSYELAGDAEIFIVVGTSGVVQPAANLPFVAKSFGARIYVVNPQPTIHTEIADLFLQTSASEGLRRIDELLQGEGPS